MPSSLDVGTECCDGCQASSFGEEGAKSDGSLRFDWFVSNASAGADPISLSVKMLVVAFSVFCSKSTANPEVFVVLSLGAALSKSPRAAIKTFSNISIIKAVSLWRGSPLMAHRTPSTNPPLPYASPTAAIASTFSLSDAATWSRRTALSKGDPVSLSATARWIKAIAFPMYPHSANLLHR